MFIARYCSRVGPLFGARVGVGVQNKQGHDASLGEEEANKQHI